MAKLEVTLKQHTPLIHFESDIEGATLRATELKPKLDKFLIECFKEEDINYSKYLIKGQKKAFNYKIKIKNIKGWKKEQIDEKFPLFFGNTGVKEESEKKFFVSCNTLDVEFFSFDKELLDLIESKLAKFLLITNFGTRQGKGFGSFFIDKNDKLYKEKDIIQMYKKNKKNFIYIDTKINNFKIFEIIDIFYKLMKSGVNYPDFKNDKGKTYYKSFLVQYFLKKNIGNEKKFIKENFFKQNIRVEKDNMKKEYVRGLLGTNESIEFKDKERKGKIIYESKDVERFKSPIIFKIIDGYIFIFAEKSIDNIKGKEFLLYEKNKKENGLKIKIPTNFNLELFLFDYADYINLKIKSDDKVNNIFAKQIKLLKQFEIKKVGDK